MISWLQQNFRLKETLLKKFEMYRKSRTINGREMKKNEAFNTLLESALTDIELLEDGMYFSKPDIRIILDKLAIGDDLLVDEVKFVFQYLNNLALSRKYPVSKKIVSFIFDVAIVQSRHTSIDDLGYMLGNTHFTPNDKIYKTVDLLRKQKEYFESKENDIITFNHIEMPLRNPFICIRDFEVANIIAINKVVEKYRKILFRNLTFYYCMKNPDNPALKKSLELCKYKDKTLLNEKVGENGYHISMLQNEKYGSDFDLYGSFNIQGINCFFNSYLALQLTKLSLMGIEFNYEDVPYFRYPKLPRVLYFGLSYAYVEDKDVKEFLDVFKKAEDDNKQVFEALKDVYGEIV